MYAKPGTKINLSWLLVGLILCANIIFFYQLSKKIQVYTSKIQVSRIEGFSEEDLLDIGLIEK